MLVFRQCYEGYVHRRIQNRKARLAHSEIDVVSLAQSYDALAESGNLDQVATHTRLGAADKEDYVDLYEAKFRTSSGRAIYDQLFTSALVCPYCGRGEIRTLDHFLPKNDFPGVAVHTRNLIPSCYPCNHEKGARSHANTGTSPVHPYFDNVPQGWLVCELQPGKTVAPTFAVAASVPSSLHSRLNEHMVTYGLSERFAIYAVSDLVESRSYLLELGDSQGPNGIRAHCAEEARKIARPDSWRRRLYETLSSSDWFCSVGFTAIEG